MVFSYIFSYISLILDLLLTSVLVCLGLLSLHTVGFPPSPVFHSLGQMEEAFDSVALGIRWMLLLEWSHLRSIFTNTSQPFTLSIDLCLSEIIQALIVRCSFLADGLQTNKESRDQGLVLKIDKKTVLCSFASNHCNYHF